jgi:formamidopyrimidine-DNA glycosylase
MRTGGSNANFEDLENTGFHELPQSRRNRKIVCQSRRTPQTLPAKAFPFCPPIVRCADLELSSITMPELPDIVIYIEALQSRIVGRTLEGIRIVSPSLLRTASPPIAAAEGKQALELKRMGKRICIGLEDDLWLVLHLMIAGRLHWKPRGAKLARPLGLAAFDFENGTLLLTEAGSQKRASLHLVRGRDNLQVLDPGGLEIFHTTAEEFGGVLQRENHTLKRALTDPRLFSGIGNAYSDEILFQAQLSPMQLTQKMTPEQIEELFSATRMTLQDWTDRLRAEAGEKFPEKVTAFREDMTVHGKYKEKCPRCGNIIQRIRYGANEANYCPFCQTGNKLLADRSLSRLLREDWPKTPEALELFIDKRRQS